VGADLDPDLDPDSDSDRKGYGILVPAVDRDSGCTGTRLCSLGGT
jgi:hypothetical protein